MTIIVSKVLQGNFTLPTAFISLLETGEELCACLKVLGDGVEFAVERRGTPLMMTGLFLHIPYRFRSAIVCHPGTSEPSISSILDFVSSNRQLRTLEIEFSPRPKSQHAVDVACQVVEAYKRNVGLNMLDVTFHCEASEILSMFLHQAASHITSVSIRDACFSYPSDERDVHYIWANSIRSLTGLQTLQVCQRGIPILPLLWLPPSTSQPCNLQKVICVDEGTYYNGRPAAWIPGQTFKHVCHRRLTNQPCNLQKLICVNWGRYNGRPADGLDFGCQGSEDTRNLKDFSFYIWGEQTKLCTKTISDLKQSNIVSLTVCIKFDKSKDYNLPGSVLIQLAAYLEKDNKLIRLCLFLDHVGGYFENTTARSVGLDPSIIFLALEAKSHLETLQLSGFIGQMDHIQPALPLLSGKASVAELHIKDDLESLPDIVAGLRHNPSLRTLTLEDDMKCFRYHHTAGLDLSPTKLTSMSLRLLLKPGVLSIVLDLVQNPPETLMHFALVLYQQRESTSLDRSAFETLLVSANKSQKLESFDFVLEGQHGGGQNVFNAVAVIIPKLKYLKRLDVSVTDNDMDFPDQQFVKDLAEAYRNNQCLASIGLHPLQERSYDLHREISEIKMWKWIEASGCKVIRGTCERCSFAELIRSLVAFNQTFDSLLTDFGRFWTTLAYMWLRNNNPSWLNQERYGRKRKRCD